MNSIILKISLTAALIVNLSPLLATSLHETFYGLKSEEAVEEFYEENFQDSNGKRKTKSLHQFVKEVDIEKMFTMPEPAWRGLFSWPIQARSIQVVFDKSLDLQQKKP